MKQLETYQKKLLKQIISVPTNTVDLAVYILTGLLPVETQLDKKVLILFNSVCRQNENSVEKSLAYRQCSVKTIKSNSWFMDVKKIIWKCQMNDIEFYLDNPISKIRWKSLVNRTVNAYWYKGITTIVPYYRNLSYLNYLLYTPGKLHHLHHL